MGVGINDLTAIKVYEDSQRVFKHLNSLASSAITAIDAGNYDVSQLRAAVIDSFVNAFNALPDVDGWSAANKLELNDYVATATTHTDYATEYTAARLAARDVGLAGLAIIPTDAGGFVQELTYAADGAKTYNTVGGTTDLRAKLVAYTTEAQNGG